MENTNKDKIWFDIICQVMKNDKSVLENIYKKESKGFNIDSLFRYIIHFRFKNQKIKKVYKDYLEEQDPSKTIQYLKDIEIKKNKKVQKPVLVQDKVQKPMQDKVQKPVRDILDIFIKKINTEKLIESDQKIVDEAIMSIEEENLQLKSQIYFDSYGKKPINQNTLINWYQNCMKEKNYQNIPRFDNFTPLNKEAEDLMNQRNKKIKELGNKTLLERL